LVIFLTLLTELPLELQSNILHTQSIQYHTSGSALKGGNKKKAKELMLKALKILPTNSPLRKFLIPPLGNMYSGKLKDIESEIKWLEKQPGCRSIAAYIHFKNYLHLCNTIESRKLIPIIDEDPDDANFRGYKVEIQILDFLEGNWKFGNQHQNECKDFGLNNSMMIDKCLLEKNPKKALEWAKFNLELNGHFNINNNILMRFDSGSLVKCELSCKNAESAKKIMDMREESGGENSELDWTRLELLNGNKNKSMYHFEKVLKEVKKYGGEYLLDYELKKACEVSPLDLFQLGKQFGKLKNKLPANPMIDKKKYKNKKSKGLDCLLGDSLKIKEVKEKIRLLADKNIDVIIFGETGAGKELVARALHEESYRREKPFLAINCGALPDDLLQSELFGFTKGAFTGADKKRKGFFEEVGEGTLFLDEIGDISPKLQTTLLRVLENKEYRPLGSEKSNAVTCRIITATNVELENKVQSGKFRQDLYYRLKRMEINVHPLKARGADIILLAEIFLNENRESVESATISNGLKDILLNYEWPGNVRELKNEMERMRIMHSDKLNYDLTDLNDQIINQVLHIDSSLKNEELSMNINDNNYSGKETIDKKSKNKTVESVKVFQESRSQFRQLDRLKKLFETHQKLTRKEITQLLMINPKTATSYLNALIEGQFIEKITPSLSPRSHYFAIKLLQ